MNLDQFNTALREMFEEMLSDGFQQNDISAITFGKNRQDQMKEFLRGRRVSGKPLINMFHDLGFEVHIVPISQLDSSTIENINEITTNAFEALRITFVNYLENKDNMRRKKKNIILFIDYIIKKINDQKKRGK